MFALLLMMTDDKIRDKLEDLYITYHKELLYVAYHILNDYHESEDILQSAFIKMSKHLDKIGDTKCKKTRAYVVIVVRNLALDRYRQKKRTIPTDFTQEMYTEGLVDEKISLEDHVLHLESGKEMARIMGNLHPDYADIISLKYYYEYTNPEIAELLNISIDNVSVRLYRAKAALKKLLSEGGNKG